MSSDRKRRSAILDSFLFQSEDDSVVDSVNGSTALKEEKINYLESISQPRKLSTKVNALFEHDIKRYHLKMNLSNCNGTEHQDSDGVILLKNFENSTLETKFSERDISSYLKKSSEEMYTRLKSYRDEKMNFSANRSANHLETPKRDWNKANYTNKICHETRPTVLYQPIYIIPPYLPHHHVTSKQTTVNSSTEIYYPEPNKEAIINMNYKSLTENPKEDKKRGFQCPVCSKVYCRKYVLKIHMRTHSGEKPLECEECGKCFSDPSNMNKHMRLHRGEISPYYCKFCHRNFNRRRDLSRHISAWHKQEDNGLEFAEKVCEKREICDKVK